MDFSDSDAPYVGRKEVNAEAYVRAYYPRGTHSKLDGPDEVEEDVKAAIASMKDVPSISIQALSDVWPGEIVPEEVVRNSTVDGSNCETIPMPLDNSSVPSLSDLTLLRALGQAIETGCFDEIEHILWHPGKAKTLLSTIQETSSQQLIDKKTLLSLNELLKFHRRSCLDSHMLDLSSFQLSSEQICSLLWGNLDVQTLDMFHNYLVDIHAVKAILETVPRLRKLILLNTPIFSQDWTDILSQLFKHLEAIIHPGFYNSEAEFKPQFLLYVVDRPSRRIKKGCTALPFFTSSQIIQGIQVLLKLLENEKRGLHWLCSDIAEGFAASIAVSLETLRPVPGGLKGIFLSSRLRLTRQYLTPRGLLA